MQGIDILALGETDKPKSVGCARGGWARWPRLGLRPIDVIGPKAVEAYRTRIAPVPIAVGDARP